MKNNISAYFELVMSFLPFIFFVYLNSKANIEKEYRNRQYIIPVLSILYSIIIFIFQDEFYELVKKTLSFLSKLSTDINNPSLAQYFNGLYSGWNIYLAMILFNTIALIAFYLIKKMIIKIVSEIKIKQDTLIGKIISIFYTYEEDDNRWYVGTHFGQSRNYVKTAYYTICIISLIMLLISCYLCINESITEPYSPVFAIIVVGEVAYFLDGLVKSEHKSTYMMQSDKSRHIAMYPLLRKPLKVLFGDKLSAEGTTINNGVKSGGAIEDILISIERNGGHIGKNYATFIRKKMSLGFKPNIDYLRCGYDLAAGKNLLFNTPFYDKLNPYAFYAMNRELLKGNKVLIVLGRHGTEDDLKQWISDGMKAISNIPDIWKTDVLGREKKNEDEFADIGIITSSGVHDLEIHRNNMNFLNQVSFVLIVEPSRLVTTAQIGLNLLIRYCGKDTNITFCSVDRNCDGLVDALSHILMTNITEVSATEYPKGMSSYMYWTADNDYLQHRIVPGVSRCLGMGTELSMVALKNQAKSTVWYGGDAFPVIDAHWISKQYYYDLLDYANLPANQETFDNCFKASFNMSNERISDYSFITVEDDRNNLFETRRNFATIAQQQGFVNVISSEYMLREYMALNQEIFTADAKAIPYITADYARTVRNEILSLCLLLCVETINEETLIRKLNMLNINTKEPVTEIWKMICMLFGEHNDNYEELRVKGEDGKEYIFIKDNILVFRRQYNIRTGMFENVYSIENKDFANIILADMQNAKYIAEVENEDICIGTELKGHVYQRYLPGQFFTLNGKYYEMISTTSDNRILVRRASEHIGGRLSYRQLRNYTITHIEDSSTMGELKTVNNIEIHYQFADFNVETPGYWKLNSHNDFDNGKLVTLNGIPVREYKHKQILKFDFSNFGEAFTDSIRTTLTALLNESFVTLFAENSSFISAVTLGTHEAPVTYNLDISEDIEGSDKCIYIIEDSQLDIGLLIAVERNINRILQIISDYLSWNDEMIEYSAEEEQKEEEEKTVTPVNIFEDYPDYKKETILDKIKKFFKKLFRIKDKPAKEKTPAENTEDKENILEDNSDTEAGEETIVKTPDIEVDEETLEEVVDTETTEDIPEIQENEPTEENKEDKEDEQL